MKNKNQAEGNRNIQILQQERAKGYPDLKACGEALLRLTSEAFPKPAEPSPEPEAAPASEAQAPAVPDERPKCPDCNSVGMSHCSDPEHCGGVYWPDSKYQALRDELAQLRARVAILDAQEVELPKLANDVFDKGNDNNLAASLQEDKAERVFDSKWEASRLLGWWLEQRERQLLDALRAVQACREVAQQQNEALKFLAQEADGEISPATFEFANSAAAAYDALVGKDGE